MQCNAVIEQIRTFLIKNFPTARTRRVSDDEPLIANGIVDSLGILEVVAFLEQEWQVTVSDEELLPENFQSIESLAAYVQRKLSQSTASLAKE
jgi:acyl carrier protein